jgi:hypothetical protein
MANQMIHSAIGQRMDGYILEKNWNQYVNFTIIMYTKA